MYLILSMTIGDLLWFYFLLIINDETLKNSEILCNKVKKEQGYLITSLRSMFLKENLKYKSNKTFLMKTVFYI